MKKRTDIQALRGISVLAVILFHLKGSFFPNGYLGVDIFFVISGLVITPIICRINLSNYRAELKNFYIKRFLRLVPALGCTLTVSAIFIYLFGNIVDLQKFAYQGLHSIFFVGNFGAQKYSENYFAPSPNPLIHTWSLAVEEQIYFVLPIVLLCYLQINKKARNIRNLFLILFLISFSTYLSTYYISLNSNFLGEISTQKSFYLAFPRLWEFIAGSILSFYSRSERIILKKHQLKLRSAYLFATILILLIPLHLPKITSIFTIVLFSCAYLMTIDGDSKNSLLSWVGDRSYSIYIVHMPLIYLTSNCFAYSNGLIRKIAVVITLSSIFILGHLQYKYIEQKFRFSSRVKFHLGSRNLVKISSMFLLLPSLFFVLILVSISLDLKPLLNKKSSDGITATKLLADAGCVDKSFDKLNCTWKSKGSKGLILLVGDSQANSASAGIANAAKVLKLDFVGVSTSGCPFLKLDSTGIKPIDCLPFQDSILQYIEEVRPKFVFIANRASGYNNPQTNWRTYLDTSGTPAKTRKKALMIYETHLESMAIALKRFGSTVLLFQDVPEVTNLARPNSIFESILQENRPSKVKELKVKLDEPTRNIESNLAKSGLIYIYDPSKYLCTVHCNSIKKSEFYLDSWHLTKAGSLNLTNSLVEFISPLMPVKGIDS